MEEKRAKSFRTQDAATAASRVEWRFDEVEVLVYNVSHVDLILGLQRPPNSPGSWKGPEKVFEANAYSEEDYLALNERGKASSQLVRTLAGELLLARPRFDRFFPISKKILQAISSLGDSGVKLLQTIFDIEEANPDKEEEDAEDAEEVLDSRPAPTTGSEMLLRGNSRGSVSSISSRLVPTGVRFDGMPICDEEWENVVLKVREEKYKANAMESGNKEPTIVAAMIPLISQMVQTWIDMIETDNERTHQAKEVRKIVMLISGAGRPRNRELDLMANSTKGTAELAQFLILETCPDVEVTCLDSGLDVFHYAENVRFCNEILLPAVEKLRKPLVEDFGNEWVKRLRMTVGLTDGSPARLAALNASLRAFHPNYLHMWQLKTFWHEYKFLSSDILYQTFETMEARPPVPYEYLNEDCRLLVDEMRKHKEQFAKAKRDGHLEEMSSFWLRKTKKVVLAVLMVKAEKDKKSRYFRGMNLEVSMPTGSLCSERNVIGTALASDPTLRRKDLKYIAVLSMTLETPLTPMGSALSAKSTSPSKRESLGSSDSVRCFEPVVRSSSEHETSPNAIPKSRTLAKRSRSQSSSKSVNSASAALKFQGELNPIAPCGACNEWLKKIAEVNPAFKVVTFPNSDCLEAFVREIS